MDNSHDSNLDRKEALRELIHSTAYYLDREDFAGYMSLFADGAQYEITAKSREIGGKETVWMRMDKGDLTELLAEVPDHLRDEAERIHLVSPVLLDADDHRGSGVSHFAVYRTTTAGESHVYAVGHYEDTFVYRDGKWLYAKHRVVVHTRMLEIPTHVPL